MAYRFQVDTGGTLLTSLVSYYQAEDANDFYGTYHLTNNGSTPFNAGKINNAPDFTPGSSQYLHANVHSYERTQALSMCGWVKFDDTGVDRYILSRQNNTSPFNGVQYFRRTSDNRLVFGMGAANSTGARIRTAATFTTDTASYHFFVVTYDGSSTAAGMHIYWDGSEAATTSYQDNLNASTLVSYDFFISGGANPAANFMDGHIDEVGIWTKVLSSQEMTDLYNSGNGQTMIFDPDISVIETITVSESVTMNEADLGGINVNEVITVAENVSITNSDLGDVSVFDTVTITEFATIDLPFNISVFDSVSVSEDISATNSDLGGININETITITESITIQESAQRKGFIKMRSTQQSYPIPMDDNRTL